MVPSICRRRKRDRPYYTIVQTCDFEFHSRRCSRHPTPKYEYTHSHAQITSHTAHIAHPYLRHVTHTATCTCTPRHTHTEMCTQQKENMSYTSEQNYTLQRAVVFTGFLRIVRMSTVVLGGTISRSLRARALCRVGPAYGSTIQ